MLIVTSGLLRVYDFILGPTAANSESPTSMPTSMATTAGLDDIFYSYGVLQDAESELVLRDEYTKISIGLLMVWLCMLGMELMQPVFRAHLLYNIPYLNNNSSSSSSTVNDATSGAHHTVNEHRYCKCMFLVKILVILLNAVMCGQYKHLHASNYIIATMVITCLPSLCDVCKLCYDSIFVRGSTVSKRTVTNNTGTSSDNSSSSSNIELQRGSGRHSTKSDGLETVNPVSSSSSSGSTNGTTRKSSGRSTSQQQNRQSKAREDNSDV